MDSRVLIHYATASLFASVNKLEGRKDIRHIESIEQSVKREKIKSQQSFKGKR